VAISDIPGTDPDRFKPDVRHCCNGDCIDSNLDTANGIEVSKRVDRAARTLHLRSGSFHQAVSVEVHLSETARLALAKLAETEPMSTRPRPYRLPRVSRLENGANGTWPCVVNVALVFSAARLWALVVALVT
jgi:hypothetical protein